MWPGLAAQLLKVLIVPLHLSHCGSIPSHLSLGQLCQVTASLQAPPAQGKKKKKEEMRYKQFIESSRDAGLLSVVQKVIRVQGQWESCGRAGVS